MHHFETNQTALREEEQAEARVLASLREAGMDRVPEEALVDRLVRLEQQSRFNEDARMIERGMIHILDYFESQPSAEYPNLHFSPEQRQDARIAAIVHDIGKSGPAQATPEQRMAVIKTFAIEGVLDPHMTVSEAVAEYYDQLQHGQIIKALSECGVDPHGSMRDFWDQHAQWTHDILEAHGDGVPQRAKVIAASHHIDRGINPYSIPEHQMPAEAYAIGAMEDYLDAMEGRLLIALDKYEAALRRGSLDHAAALQRVRDILGSRYEHDLLMQRILQAIDILGRKGELF